jgi:hypothetical protein
MRYTATIGFAAGGGETWEETFDDAAVNSDQEAEVKARALVKWFNETLRPGERERAFHAARVIGESIAHQWEKTSLVTTTSSSGRMFDKMKCRVCGITGRRYGLDSVTRDAKYRSRKYEDCTWKKAHG